MLSDALRYPLNGDGWLRTILVGGLLTVLSVLVIPAFLIQGYYVRVLRGVANDDPDPPVFDDWVALFVDGLKLVVVNILVVLAVVVVLGLVGITFGGGSILAGGGAESGAASGILGAAGVAAVVVVSLLISYVTPAMFTNFAREDSIAAAFDVSTILAGALTVEYFVAWLLALVVGIVLGAIASFLSLLLVGIFGLFYTQVVTYYLFGRGFVDGLAASGDGVSTTATPR